MIFLVVAHEVSWDFMVPLVHYGDDAWSFMKKPYVRTQNNVQRKNKN